MKEKFKIIFTLLILILIGSISYNLYQHNRINNYKRELTNNIRVNIQKFAGLSSDIDNEIIYIEKYSSIVLAQNSYISLNEKSAIPNEEWTSSLAGLFVKIKHIMLNDKNKFKKVFEETNASELMLKISDNFEDKDSIGKVYKLLSE